MSDRGIVENAIPSITIYKLQHYRRIKWDAIASSNGKSENLFPKRITSKTGSNELRDNTPSAARYDREDREITELSLDIHSKILLEETITTQKNKKREWHPQNFSLSSVLLGTCIKIHHMVFDIFKKFFGEIVILCNLLSNGPL